MKKFLFNYVIPYLLYGVVYLWCWTLRMKNLNSEAEEHIQKLTGPYILTLWHGRIFYLFYYLRNRPDYFLLISPSVDGDLLAKLARLMGYSVIRGSTFKKAVPAARSLIRVLREGQRIIIIADGSRGPRCVAQSGSIQLAGITKTPLFPMTFGAKNKAVLNTWDRFILPLPFTRCSINFGPPIHISSRSSEDLVEEKRLELESSLKQLDAESDSA
ncbi:MAG: lysophospholipid acyltransferase family protein [Nitrospinae bacterium]|nr:lysophospholipid acyltransferase family protein [Nitrospinota bacterium]MZH13872.1 lysophospholipid acyltransferase family protein [Nitrospinota bacterium]